MGRYAQDPGGDFKPAPAGTHVAICVRLTDLGTQHSEYNGQAQVKNQILITWELPNEKMDDGQPFLCSHFYTNSLHEKATLRDHLESWRGRAFTDPEAEKFDLMNLLGKSCMVSIIHNDKGKAKISAVMAIPKGTSVPQPHNKLASFWLDEFSQDAYDEVSDGIKKIIEKSDEWSELRNGGASSHEPTRKQVEDQIPF